MSYSSSEDDSDFNKLTSTKYIPRRQPNPHLKKYYSGRRALPWRRANLARYVSGYETDLDVYEKDIWEEAKKTKIKQRRREEWLRERKRGRSLDEGDDDDDDQDTTSAPVKRSRRTTKRVKPAPKHELTNSVKIKSKRQAKKTQRRQERKQQNPKRQRPRWLSHFYSALKATSKRQGHLHYVTRCGCCRIYDRPWILKRQDFKRSLSVFIREGVSMSSVKHERGGQIQMQIQMQMRDDNELLKRPSNPQTGRIRYHEGREKAWRKHRDKNNDGVTGNGGWFLGLPRWFRIARWSWGVGLGGRGLRGWMREELRRRRSGEEVGGYYSDDDDGEDSTVMGFIGVIGPGWYGCGFGLGDIELGEHLPYPVRFVMGRIARHAGNVHAEEVSVLGEVEMDKETMSLDWGLEMEEMQMEEEMQMDLGSEDGLDAWVQGEWVCLSVDGCEDDMALSWIEVDDTPGEDGC